MSVFMQAAPHVNASPIPDIFCKCDVSQRQKEILHSPGVHSETHKTRKTGKLKNEGGPSVGAL